MKVTDFDWDETNLEHIARHRVLPEEAEEVLLSDCEVAPAIEGCKLAIGQTEAGRYLLIVFREKPGSAVRVITARELTERQKRAYRRRRGK